MYLNIISKYFILFMMYSFAGWIMESGQRIAGVHITSGMVLPAAQYRCYWKNSAFSLFWFLYPHKLTMYIIRRVNNDNYSLEN